VPVLVELVAPLVLVLIVPPVPALVVLIVPPVPTLMVVVEPLTPWPPDPDVELSTPSPHPRAPPTIIIHPSTPANRRSFFMKASSS
jgi:hypothetical protein